MTWTIKLNYYYIHKNFFSHFFIHKNFVMFTLAPLEKIPDFATGKVLDT